VVSAFLTAAETAPRPQVAGQVFNVGGAPPLSLRDLAEQIIAANGGVGHYEMKDFPADRAPIDIGSFAADDRAFRGATGWWPRIGVEEGLRRSLEWYRPRLAEYTA
jgi:UDP-glucose 4-epimerase